ncbi:MAG: glucose 1-dehydrogenase [Clostridia bacterium]|nr:glucose 1-dehydrogenase [Clostridia bacterium]
MVQVNMKLTGQVAVITGSTKGIGYGIASALGAEGANIVVTGRKQEDCYRAAEEIQAKYGVKVLAQAADLANYQDIDHLVNKILSTFGRIDILVNNAGTAITKRAEDITAEEWDQVLNVNLKGAFFCAQACGREMIRRKYGKIINVASILGLVAAKQVLPYCVAKGGMIQMTKALALEWARYNIRVNALCPGYVRTTLNEAQLKQEKVCKRIVSRIPLGRLGEINDLVGASVFLASQASDYMTGQVITVDGGWTAE